MSKKIDVNGTSINLINQNGEDFICITDMAKAKKDGTKAEDVINNWIRSRSTLEFLGTWERIYNPDFKDVESDHFKALAGLHSFVLSPSKWVEKTKAIGIFTKTGRLGGTFAHKDIAFEFGSSISAEFKLYLIKEFQRQKENQNQKQNQEWNLQRTLSKINYSIHTDAIKENLIPKELSPRQQKFIYSSEADLLNVALFGETARDWRERRAADEGNLRDSASLEQLVVMSNMESINALLIQHGLTQGDRLLQLNTIAIDQMKSLAQSNPSQRLN